MKRKILFAILIGLLFITIMSGCKRNEDSENSEHKTFLHEESSYGRYWVSAYCPDGYGNLGGDTKIEFSVYDEENRSARTRFTFSVYTSCEKPDEDNYSIEWYEDYVIISVIDDAGGPNTTDKKVIRVYWEDLYTK